MQRRPLILVSLLLAAFVINLDITIVNVALPTLVRELHASNSQLQWVVDAYSLVFAALLLAAGSLSDRLGRKGFLLAGLVVFGLASVAGGLTEHRRPADRRPLLHGSRRRDDLPHHPLADLERVHRAGRARPARSASGARPSASAVALGPIVGGWLLEQFSWTSIFFAMAPVAAVGAALVAWSVPTSRDPGAHKTDGPGLVLSSAAMALLTYTIIEAPGHGWSSARTLAGFALAAALFAAFIVRERTRRGADARPQPVPQPALHRRERLRDRRLLRAIRVQLPDHPVLPVLQGLRAAVHRRSPPARGRLASRSRRCSAPSSPFASAPSRSSPSVCSVSPPSSPGSPPHAQEPATSRSPARWCSAAAAWASSAHPRPKRSWASYRRPRPASAPPSTTPPACSEAPSASPIIGSVYVSLYNSRLTRQLPVRADPRSYARTAHDSVGARARARQPPSVTTATRSLAATPSTPQPPTPSSTASAPPASSPPASAPSADDRRRGTAPSPPRSQG